MKKFKYIDLINLGFKREDYEDGVYFKEFGIHPFHMIFKLSKRIELYANSEDFKVYLMRYDKELSVLGKMEINSLSVIKDIIKFFKDK